jgi:hypothetical protein
VIHYHGGPFSTPEVAVAVWKGRHALVSFARPDQIDLAAEISQSFCLDNGAFSAWRRGLEVNWSDYYAWVDKWRWHPGFDFAIIPDVIGGSEEENDDLIHRWCRRFKEPMVGVPVWHMHESMERLERLAFCWPATSLWRFPRLAIGSSGQYSQVGTDVWWHRMEAAMDLLFSKSHTLYGLQPVHNVPPPKVHGLRMLNPKIFSRLPLASADSTNIARNVQLDCRWTGSYSPATKKLRGLVLADRIEAHNALGNWGLTHPTLLQGKYEEYSLLDIMQ